MLLSFAEENYLKTIYHLSQGGQQEVSTNAIAEALDTKAASVSDMIRKLHNKGAVSYQKYQGVNISPEGGKAALQIIRKHRLWEVFLVEKLKFNWDEVHEIAEQLEHIRSPLLIKRLDEFLGFPKMDPHGDPIPDENGEFKEKPKTPLNEAAINQSGIIVGVKDTSVPFLQYIDRLGANLGAKLRVMDKVEFDGSMELLIDGKKHVFISKEVAKNILITE